MIPNATKYYEIDRNISLGSNRVDWVRSLWKIRRDFAAPTLALIEQVHPIMHRVSCSYEKISNAPKHYETHQNMSLGSNGVDQVRSLWKITTWLRGTNFCINCTSSICFASSFMQLQMVPNAPKYCETDRNISLGFQWGGWGALVAKNYNATSWHEHLHLLHQFSMFCNKFHAVTKRSQMHRNTLKRTETLV